MLARSVNCYMYSKLECDFVPSFLSHLNLRGTTPRIIPSKFRGEALNAILVHPNEGVRLTKMQVGEPAQADSPIAPTDHQVISHNLSSRRCPFLPRFQTQTRSTTSEPSLI